MSCDELLQLIIFKEQPYGRISREWFGNIPSTHACASTKRENAWMDESSFKVGYPLCIGRPATLLLQDEFASHMASDYPTAICDLGALTESIILRK